MADDDNKRSEDRRGKRLTPEEFRAVTELFEIFVRWDDEARAKAGVDLTKDVDSSEPVKLVTLTK